MLLKRNLIQYIIFLGVFLGTLPLCVTGQGNSIRTFTREGMAGTEYVNTLHQDEKGYFWLGTDEGLLRFDGNHYIRLDTSDGLAENSIKAACLTSKGILWLGHQNGGVSYCKGQICKTFSTGDIIQDVISGIAEDKLGNVWIAARRGFLMRVDLSGNYTVYEKQIEGISILCMAAGREDNLLLGTPEGLVIFNTNSQQKIPDPVENFPAASVLAVSVSAAEDGFWAAVQDEAEE